MDKAELKAISEFTEKVRPLLYALADEARSTEKEIGYAVDATLGLIATNVYLNYKPRKVNGD